MENKIFCQKHLFCVQLHSSLSNENNRSHLPDVAPERKHLHMPKCVEEMQHALIMLMLANFRMCSVWLIIRSKPVEEDSCMHANGAPFTANDTIHLHFNWPSKLLKPKM